MIAIILLVAGFWMGGIMGVIAMGIVILVLK